jgi:hypothetical protein
LQAVLIERIKSLDRIGTMCCPGSEGGRRQGKLTGGMWQGGNSGEPSGQDSTSAFGETGAMGKGGRDVIGGAGAVNGFSTSAISGILQENNPKNQGVIQPP